MIKTRFFLILLVTLCIVCNGCTSSPSRIEGREEKEFNLKSLGKGDIDTVLDIHVREAREYCRLLMEKLYKRNPRELAKNPVKSVDSILERVFGKNHNWEFTELDNIKGIDAIRLALSNDYEGDRVFVFIVGLTSMIMDSYEYKVDFYMFDDVDPQKLYNSARNIEIAVWKVEHDLDANGELFLYTNSLPGEETNLSYERLFGKLIAIQDTMALIMEQKTNRVIKKVLQRMATAVFLPI
ncbi:MAG: hypothetical protein R3318_06095 [Gammaproteobacteria bacterium]|nr:hypothetical protein [Gammaproteobacteria bacterium]